MKNFNMYLPLVDGSRMDCFDDNSGKNIIHELITDDFAAPPSRLCIEVTTTTGKKVCIHIPYDHTSEPSVTIDGENLI